MSSMEEDVNLQNDSEPLELDENELEVFLPGQELKEGEILVHDSSAYDMLHSMNVTWPCLSFDFLKQSSDRDLKPDGQLKVKYN